VTCVRGVTHTHTYRGGVLITHTTPHTHHSHAALTGDCAPCLDGKLGGGPGGGGGGGGQGGGHQGEGGEEGYTTQTYQEKAHQWGGLQLLPLRFARLRDEDCISGRLSGQMYSRLSQSHV